MDAILYQVNAVFSDRSVAAEYIEWLAGAGGCGHIDDVIRGGASGAQVIVWDGEAEHTGETRTVVQY